MAIDFGRIANSSRDRHDYAEKVQAAIGKDGTLTAEQGASMSAAWAEKQSRNATSQNEGQISLTEDSPINVFKRIIETQEAGQYFKSYKEEMMNINDIFNIFIDGEKRARTIPEILGSLVNIAFNGIELFLQQQNHLRETLNRQTGITGLLSREFRKELTQANPELLRMGVSFGDLAESASRLVEQSGRFNLINQETFVRAGEVAMAYVGTLQELVKMYPEFEKIGHGAADASEIIAQAGHRTLELGMSSVRVTSELSTHLSKLNEYGFSNGVRGLEEMVRRSIEFRSNIESVLGIADRVWDPAGAIELSANLQVIGGAIGDFNDPLKMMYMATNNVEGLQDALLGAAKGLATYNDEQGRFEITGVNLRRARAMATELGVSLGELSKTAIAAAERASVSTELMASGLILEEDQERFITNLAQMKEGRMVIELQSQRLQDIFGGTEIAVEELTENQARLLLSYQDEFRELSEGEIIRNQYSAVENIKKDLNYLVALARVQAGSMGQAVAEGIGFDLRKLADDSIEESRRAGKTMLDYSKDAQLFLKDLGVSAREFVTEYIGGKPIETTITENELRRQETERRTQSQEPTPPTRTVRVEHRVTSEPIVDGLQRSIVRNPSTYNNLLEEEQGSYLVPTERGGRVVSHHLN